MEDCVFCRIVRGEISAEKLVETKSALAFLDIRPKSLGHSLVIPKSHVVKLADLDDESTVDVFTVTRDLVRTLNGALKPDAFTIGINDGRAAGQEVAHLHVNIIPRFRGDGGRAIHSVVNNPPQEDISVTARRIRSSSWP